MNETNWWDKEPYRKGFTKCHDSWCECGGEENAIYNIPAIIQAVREEERKKFIEMFSAQNISGEPVSKSNPSPKD